MGRLIDADNITDKQIIEYLGLRYASCACDVRDMLDAQPTAYDPDKVVDQLNDKFRVVRTDEDLEWNRAMDEAITIVKGGGVDGN